MPFGNNFKQTKPSILLGGVEVGTGASKLRRFGEFIDKYVAVPSKAKPCVVTFTVPSGCVVHYTFGPQYPSAKVDNITCFKYEPAVAKDIARRTLSNMKNGQDGLHVYAVAYKLDANSKPQANDQSNVVFAEFHVSKS